MSMNYKGKKPVVDCTGDKGFTDQSGRDDADINKIVARFEKGGTLARLNAKEPFYGDVSGFTGLADCLIKVQEAEDLFMSYDAKIRERFENSAVKFVEFMEDASNMDEAIDLGLVSKPVVEPVPAPVVPSGTDSVTIKGVKPGDAKFT